MTSIGNKHKLDKKFENPVMSYITSKKKVLLTMDQLPFLPFLDDDLKKGDGIGRGQKAQKDKSSHVFVL